MRVNGEGTANPTGSKDYGMSEWGRKNTAGVVNVGHTIGARPTTGLRKALYMPAVVGKNHNPIIQASCERLEKNGKKSMVVIGAAMRKLIHIVYGVLKSGKPFDPNYLSKP
jgi:hypothetical protein